MLPERARGQRSRAARRSASSSPKKLAKRSAGETLYILDEPTMCLHYEDVRKLLEVLYRVIEHILVAEYVLNLGPGGTVCRGEVSAQGAPEEVRRSRRAIRGSNSLHAEVRGAGE